jgi:hypothetical protein
MCSLALPVSILDLINKYTRHCFWRKYGMEDKGTALISWDKNKPKENGGLEVLNIAAHNKALLHSQIL